MLPSEGFWGAKLGNFTESSAHYTLKLVNWACAVMLYNINIRTIDFREICGLFNERVSLGIIHSPQAILQCAYHNKIYDNKTDSSSGGFGRICRM